MEVKLISQTRIDKTYLEELLAKASDDDMEFIDNIQNLEGLIAYVARVSSSRQDNPSYAGLIKFCMKHGHWSILEMGNASFEIVTTRMISSQILRHRSFNFQEFSQRYSAVDKHGIELYVCRRQDKENRQNSIDDMSDADKKEFNKDQLDNWKSTFKYYKKWLDKGCAKELARAFLPLQTTTKMYMNGTLRSWVHYIDQRCNPATQKEHRDIAEAIKQKLKVEFPIIAEAAGW